jgi:endonuclease G, mitochondrial
MDAPFEQEVERQTRAANRRFEEHAAERQANIEALDRGQLAEVNTPEELARRLDRITRYYAGDPLPTSAAQIPAAESAPAEVIESALERVVAAPSEAAPGAATEAAELAADMQGAASEADRAGVVLEKIINTNDFVGIRYLEEGVAASRAVCRVDVRDELGRDIGYGTGSMVSPRLLLTNHHVLPSAEVARLSGAEFNYQDGIDGKPLQPQLLALDPDTFFVNDVERDFALVAVAGSEQDLAAYGLNRLIEAQGKAIKGDFVTIVQHPGGEKKQVALRDNRIVDELELFLHYEADTEPGSSGSPVFNDQWEVVALHHASVPTPEHGEGTFLNEGIRASRILRFLADTRFDGPKQALVVQLRAPERLTLPAPAAPATAASSNLPSSNGEAGAVTAGSDSAAQAVIPLELTIGIRTPAASPALVTAGAGLERLVQPFRDEDLSDRRGYDEHFLGTKVALPKARDKDVVSHLDDGSYVLRYEHFSIVMDKERRLALFTVSNVDADPRRKRPETGRDYTRRALTGLGPNDQEKWFTDPRIPALHQLPDRFFTNDRASFDKGHIVRREDVAWGDSYDELRRANGDTFHVTNCSPQVADFNRSNRKGLWGELENIVLKQAATERYCLFAGPVFADNDPLFKGVDDQGTVHIAIPRQFWKIVIARSGDELQTFAFVLDQDLSDTQFEFAVDQQWRTRMASITHLQELIGLITFPKQLHDSDQYEAHPGEALRASTGIETISVTDLEPRDSDGTGRASAGARAGS